MDIPHLRIELQGIKTGIMHTFTQHNDALNQSIIKQIEETITDDWVYQEILRCVNVCINESIQDITSDHHLKRAITAMINKQIMKNFVDNEHD